MSWLATTASLCLSLLATFALADLPVHCMRSQVYGDWDLTLSAPVPNRNVACGHPSPDTNLAELQLVYEIRPVSAVLRVRLSAPNVVVDRDTAERGTFTTVVDEGMEIRIAGRVLFAKFHYHLADPADLDDDDDDLPPIDDRSAYVSDCGRTSPGQIRTRDRRAVSMNGTGRVVQARRRAMGMLPGGADQAVSEWEDGVSPDSEQRVL